MILEMDATDQLPEDAYAAVSRASTLKNGTMYYRVDGRAHIGGATPDGDDIIVDGWARPNCDAMTDINEALATAAEFAARHGIPHIFVQR